MIAGGTIYIALIVLIRADVLKGIKVTIWSNSLDKSTIKILKKENVSTTTQTKGGSLIITTTSGSYLGIGNNAYRLEKNGNSLTFVNKGRETKIILSDNGNVSIGTANPQAKLDVNKK